MGRRTTAAAIGIVVILACALVGIADAGKPRLLFADASNGGTNVYNPVEQQSRDWQAIPDFCDRQIEGIVCNRTGCLWDVDDHLQVDWLGTYLPAGQSVSFTHCLIADSGWVFGFDQFEHDLLLTITLAIDGPDLTVSSREPFCVGGPRVRDDSPLRQPIPNSDGGTGIPGSVTFTVTNDSSRTERFGRLAGLAAGSGNLGMSTSDGRWCPHGFPLVHNGNFGGGFDADGIGYWWDTND